MSGLGTGASETNNEDVLKFGGEPRAAAEATGPVSPCADTAADDDEEPDAAAAAGNPQIYIPQAHGFM